MGDNGSPFDGTNLLVMEYMETKQETKLTWCVAVTFPLDNVSTLLTGLPLMLSFDAVWVTYIFRWDMILWIWMPLLMVLALSLVRIYAYKL